MATIVRQRVELQAKKGKSLADVQAAKVSLEYDGIYGAAAGEWTTERFIAAVYEEVAPLTRAPAGRGTRR